MRGDFADLSQTTVNTDLSFSISGLLAVLLAHRDLSEEQMRFAIGEIVSGRCGEAETAALLIGLRMKGESAVEIAAAASVLQKQMIRLDTDREGILDTCGTGGDGLGTFNISTATALVVAATGVPVVKHGNRAVSSRSGSADVLAELGVAVESGVAWAHRCLDTVGIAFCFAPHFHPALARVARLRRRLGVPTLFNYLGPLLNPAGATFQLLGVARPELLDPLAGALAHLNVRRAVLVCGRDGLDEVTLSAGTLVREVAGGVVHSREWTPHDFGLASCAPADLRAADARQSAAVIRAVLEGQDGPARRVVLANAAAALWAAERVASLAEGVETAAKSLTSGRALQTLEGLVACSV